MLRTILLRGEVLEAEGLLFNTARRRLDSNLSSAGDGALDFAAILAAVAEESLGFTLPVSSCLESNSLCALACLAALSLAKTVILSPTLRLKKMW